MKLNTKRLVTRKINNSNYTHAIYYVGTSLPIAFLYASSYGWVLHNIEGLKRGIYDSLLRAKIACIELELIK